MFEPEADGRWRMTVLDALTVAEAIGDVSAKSVILPSNGHALGACVGTGHSL